jgi:hypothetical protein
MTATTLDSLSAKWARVAASWGDLSLPTINDSPKPTGEKNMAEETRVTDAKPATEMTQEEYRHARAAAIRHRPGMTAAELADLAARRGAKPEKDVRDMSPAEYSAARSKAIRSSYR